MADRRRFAVVLLLPAPVAVEVDGIRRALGDRQLARIDPHVTIVPPINLHDEQVADAMAVIDAASRGFGRFSISIGPLDRFGPGVPVRFLAVDPWAPVVEIYRRCWTGVLDRPPDRDFHPHVTVDIAGGPADGSADPAVELLAHYRSEVTIDRISLLEFEPDSGRWEVFVESRLG